MAITQWLHLSELGSDPWVLPIYAAWNKAVTENRVAVRPDAVNEAGLHITTRLNLVSHIVRRLRRDLSALVKEVDTQQLRSTSTQRTTKASRCASTIT
jgi:hypothetical protein